MDIDNRLLYIERMPFSCKKIILTENMFHISNWVLLDAKQKLWLLQLHENNLSEIDNRIPSQIIESDKKGIIGESLYFSNQFHLIRVSKYYLEKADLNGLNCQMYCAIVHEHEHINHFIDVSNGKNDLKTNIIRDNLNNYIDYSGMIQDYIPYCLQPTEYYAHKVSEEKTIKTFNRLKDDLGYDDGFKIWCDEVESVDDLVKLYNQMNQTNFTANEIYMSALNQKNRK